MTETFDPLAAWRSLPADAQERIGAAAIVHTLGLIGTMEALAPSQGFHAADVEGIRVLEAEFRDHLADAFEGEMPKRPDLTAIGVHSCRACGCTDDFACEGNCSWVEPDLCSSCAPSPAKRGRLHIETQ